MTDFALVTQQLPLANYFPLLPVHPSPPAIIPRPRTRPEVEDWLSEPAVEEYVRFCVGRFKGKRKEEVPWHLYARGLLFARQVGKTLPGRLHVDATGETELLFSLSGTEGRAADVWLDTEADDLIFVAIEPEAVRHEHRLALSRWNDIALWLTGALKVVP